MTNANRIRQMTDEELNVFLWSWKINSTASFIQHGGQEIMDAHQQLKWLQEEEGKSAPVEAAPWDGGNERC